MPAIKSFLRKVWCYLSLLIIKKECSVYILYLVYLSKMDFCKEISPL